MDKLAAVELALSRIGIPIGVLRSEARNAITSVRYGKSQDDLERYLGKVMARAGLPLNPEECKDATEVIWRIVHSHRARVSHRTLGCQGASARWEESARG